MESLTPPQVVVKLQLATAGLGSHVFEPKPPVGLGGLWRFGANCPGVRVRLGTESLAGVGGRTGSDPM